MKLLIVDSEEAKKHPTYNCQCIIIMIIIIIIRRRSRIEVVVGHTSQCHLITWRRPLVDRSHEGQNNSHMNLICDRTDQFCFCILAHVTQFGSHF